MKPKVLDDVYMNIMNEAYIIQRIKLSSGQEVCYAPDDKNFLLEKGCKVRSAKKLQPAVLLHKIGHVLYSYCRTTTSL